MARSEPLTVEMVLSKTKAEHIQTVKNLNLWGNDLEDLQLLRQMPNLEVISLSVNKITTLKEFSYCSKLQQLYLRKNLLQDIQEVRHLAKLQQLKVLWLQDNPCSQVIPHATQIDNYRLVVIRMLPNLNKLDNNIVTPEERQLSKHVKIPNADSPKLEKKESKQQQPSEKITQSQFQSQSQLTPEPSNIGLLNALSILFRELSRDGLLAASDHLTTLISSKR